MMKIKKKAKEKETGNSLENELNPKNNVIELEPETETVTAAEKNN